MLSMFPTSLIRRHFQSHQETSNALQSELPRGERISVPSCPTSKNMSTSLLLQALKSPYPANIDLINIHEMRSLVLWLENTKIRHYSLEARAPLENQADEEWKEAFQKYLEDLDCPLAWDESMTHIVHWLLRYAVSLEYHDHATQYHAVTVDCMEAAMDPNDWTPDKLPPFKDLYSETTKEKLQSVLALLRLDSSTVSPEAVDRARILLETQILPTIAAGERDPEGRITPATALDRFPLGFTTGDENVDMAAKILRMLYIKDLRGLQTSIDDAIVELQELTADPKTDAAIGKVGR